MAKPEVKNSIRKLADDPAKLQSLLDMSKQERRAELQKLGIPSLNRKEASDAIQELLGASGGGAQASAARAVEWVGAIATLAAGALAA
jgi:hypothetical protein